MRRYGYFLRKAQTKLMAHKHNMHTSNKKKTKKKPKIEKVVRWHKELYLFLFPYLINLLNKKREHPSLWLVCKIYFQLKHFNAF